ncbi:ABC transporter permease, partial [Escherichia coli]|uniref:ABC transporter permease n=1 Tax=Escherichia coli TaxID=562 RepID=UPI0033159DB9
PLEILPVVNSLSAVFHAMISVIVWILFYVIEVGIPHLTILLLPLLILPVFILITGVGWLFSAVGVFLRDIGQIITILVTALMFLSPIFYPI